MTYDLGQGIDTDCLVLQIQKVDVNYDKTSKQVDVRILKESLWSRLQHIQAVTEEVSIFLDLPSKMCSGVVYVYGIQGFHVNGS